MVTNIQKIIDLRSALDYLKSFPGELVETDVPVAPHGELAGVYRYIGAGGTVMRPTRLGPAMLFKSIKGYPGAQIAIGVMGSRERVGKLLGVEPRKLGFVLRDCINYPIKPVVIRNDKAPCQEVVHLASETDFDLRKLIPAPTNTLVDAGPYITLGMCYASHPITRVSDVTIHRLCVHGKDELSIFFTPGARHIGEMARVASELGVPLPISISIGVDPAIAIASCFEPPTTPLGFDELSIAGALRKKPVELVQCVSIEEKAIAHSEYVIEGEILPGVTVREDKNTGTGYSMPEFPGYNGVASDSCSVIRVKAVTHRQNPIFQACIGPGEEHVNMVGIPTEASIIDMIEKAIPGRVQNVYAPSAGGGKYMAVIQFKKLDESDEGRQRQAALLAFSAFSELKHIFIVDEDIDPFDMNDVMWAMNTRFQGNLDTIFIPGVRCHPLDPSESPEYSALIPQKGVSCKTIFDCTVPYRLKKNFVRAQFMEVDPQKYIPDYGW